MLHTILVHTNVSNNLINVWLVWYQDVSFCTWLCTDVIGVYVGKTVRVYNKNESRNDLGELEEQSAFRSCTNDIFCLYRKERHEVQMPVFGSLTWRNLMIACQLANCGKRWKKIESMNIYWTLQKNMLSKVQSRLSEPLNVN